MSYEMKQLFQNIFLKFILDLNDTVVEMILELVSSLIIVNVDWPYEFELLNGGLTSVIGGVISSNWIIWSWGAGFNCPITSKYDPGIKIISFSAFLK